MSRLRLYISMIAMPAHLRRTGIVALIVGTWLTAYNQGNVLLTDAFTASLFAKIALNYITPFVVANLGLLSRQPR